MRGQLLEAISIVTSAAYQASCLEFARIFFERTERIVCAPADLRGRETTGNSYPDSPCANRITCGTLTLRTQLVPA